MKVLLLADSQVGLEITRFLLGRYPEDVAAVVTTAENEIFRDSMSLGVPAYVFETSDNLVSKLTDVPLDLGVLAWWPKIIPARLREIPRLGFINTHPSLLPHNRGKHYNFWSIVEEAPFGVTLHWVDDGVDTGDIVAQQRIEYNWCDNGGTLYARAQAAVAALFRESYPRLREGWLPRIPQAGKSSFHRSAELDQASRIDLDGNYRGREILNLLRARTFPGHPGCWFEDNGERYEVRVEIRRTEK